MCVVRCAVTSKLNARCSCQRTKQYIVCVCVCARKHKSKLRQALDDDNDDDENCLGAGENMSCKSLDDNKRAASLLASVNPLCIYSFNHLFINTHTARTATMSLWARLKCAGKRCVTCIYALVWGCAATEMGLNLYRVDFGKCDWWMEIAYRYGGKFGIFSWIQLARISLWLSALCDFASSFFFRFTIQTPTPNIHFGI